MPRLATALSAFNQQCRLSPFVMNIDNFLVEIDNFRSIKMCDWTTNIFCEHEWESGMNFSQALDCIKNGRWMKREGWNGKDQFVFLVHGSQFEVNREPLNTVFQMGTKVIYRPHIDEVSRWLCGRLASFYGRYYG